MIGGIHANKFTVKNRGKLLEYPIRIFYHGSMGERDKSYKAIFSHARMVEDLLKGFVKEDWVRQLDFSTLEKKSGSYVTDELRDRHDDIVWRVRWADEWLYIYLLIEFQSEVNRFMAVRIMAYVGLLYQDLIRGKELTRNRKLPPVLPIVLYNGVRPWRAPQNVGDLIEGIRGKLEAFRPQVRYLLIDERSYELSELKSLRNLAAALFQLEKSTGPKDVRRVLDNLIEWLKAPEQASIRRAFTVWFARVFLPSRIRGERFPEFSDLQEVKTMFEEIDWTKKWKEEGLKKGRKEGREKLAKLIIRQLELKFGKLPQNVSRKVKKADMETLLEWGGRIPAFDDLKRIFAPIDD